MSEFYHASARPSIVASLIKTSLHHGLARLDALPLASSDGLLLAAGGFIKRGPDAISTANDFCYSSKPKFLDLDEVNNSCQKQQTGEENRFIDENRANLSLTCFSLKHRIAHR